MRLGLALHVGGDASADLRLGSDAVDGLLHLAMAAVAAFDGVGGGRQQRVVQEGQGLLQVRREELLECSAHVLEAADPAPQAGQLRQGRVGAAAAVEQAIDFVHDLAQPAQMRQAAGDAPQGPLLARGQMVLDEQVAMVEQVGDPAFEPLAASGDLARSCGTAGPGPAGASGPVIALRTWATARRTAWSVPR